VKTLFSSEYYFVKETVSVTEASWMTVFLELEPYGGLASPGRSGGKVSLQPLSYSRTWLFLKCFNDLFLTSQVLEKELTN